MNQSELIQFVRELGANIFVRAFDQEQKTETVCVHVHPLPLEPPLNIQGWEHALYLNEHHNGWTISSPQSADTRPLEAQELKSLLTVWIHEPDYRIFRDYTGT